MPTKENKRLASLERVYAGDGARILVFPALKRVEIRRKSNELGSFLDDRQMKRDPYVP